jgi:hypothetical protein
LLAIDLTYTKHGLATVNSVRDRSQWFVIIGIALSREQPVIQA